MPNVDKIAASKIAERIRKTIEHTNFTSEKNQAFSITASIGLTMATIEEELTTAFRRADQAVYEAKDTGRNCVKNFPTQ